MIYDILLYLVLCLLLILEISILLSYGSLLFSQMFTCCDVLKFGSYSNHVYFHMVKLWQLVLREERMQPSERLVKTLTMVESWFFLCSREVF